VDWMRTSSDKEKDPLFHPFGAGCGTPDGAELKKIADRFNDNREEWYEKNAGDFILLEQVLACSRDDEGKCIPLPDVTDFATYWQGGDRPASPILWGGFVNEMNLKSGRFAYGSTASEMFLLEYTNGMPAEQVGWGKVKPPNRTGKPIASMLRLHDFYFTKMNRDDYLSKVMGSSLVREIGDLILRKAKGTEPKGCPHASDKAQFVGLVGHDTNLANVGKLMSLGWNFDALPVEDRLSDDDPLPAGALVFELRGRGSASFVRVYYVTQSLTQMRTGIDASKPYRIRVRGEKCSVAGECDIPIDAFNDLVNRADPQFCCACVKKYAR